MERKKIDNRIRVMIENGVKLNHRTLFIIIGNKARDQVPILYDILTKSSVKARPTVLWCYKNKDEAISNHGKKRAQKIAVGKLDINESNLFDAFRVSTTIHGRYYSQTHAVLGRTYGVCVLQDFEAVTPNLLARTIETVEGGGLIILLLKTEQSLKQFYTISMDVHKRYRTEAHQTVTCRFNERLILSLSFCNRCLVLQDDLTVLPFSTLTSSVELVNPATISKSKNIEKLNGLKSRLIGEPPGGVLINLCKTYDQANVVRTLIDALSDQELKPPLTLTAARGRGKSAALGLTIAAAIAYEYVNVYVTSPHPENLITLFEFVLKGFDALEYMEHTDYTIIRSTNPDYKKAIIRINVTREYRQIIQYISPNDTHMLNAADLLLIDEAAAIPLPLVKKMIGPYLIFMASTINGYEGTGRALSLKLISQLQKENKAPPPLKLDESIRYSDGDEIERWLIDLLCLDAKIPTTIRSGFPAPEECQLCYVNRDTLFSYQKAAESFLHRLVAICVSSHYKNSPNDLQMMSDAPAHHLFCLIAPRKAENELPDILVVIQVALEGQISRKTISSSLSKGQRMSGDLIPWNIAEQFGDYDFPKLSGVRVVRVATHPNYQRMGYGKYAIKLLKDYYSGKLTKAIESKNAAEEAGIEEIGEDELRLVKERVSPRKKGLTLLQRLTERLPEKVDYIGTSYGLTEELLRFWKHADFVPVFLSHKENDLTGEHSCIMLHSLTEGNNCAEWLKIYYSEFRSSIIELLSKPFRHFPIALCVGLVENDWANLKPRSLKSEDLNIRFSEHDLCSLQRYVRKEIGFRVILDLVKDFGDLYFSGRMPELQFDKTEKSILLGIGLLKREIDPVATELNIEGAKLLSIFYNMLSKIDEHIQMISNSKVEAIITKPIVVDNKRKLNKLKKDSLKLAYAQADSPKPKKVKQ